MVGYSRQQDFRLSAIFLDENGRILKQIGLAINRGSFDPISFRTRRYISLKMELLASDQK
jgi:hypothetical protein